MSLEVHSSLSALGYVVGGPDTVVEALVETVGDSGTIVMPNQNSDNSEPLYWENPPIDIRLADKYRDNVPGFNPKSPNLRMGKITDSLRNRYSTVFSYHPNCAFMATGYKARYFMDKQSIDFGLSINSPLGKMYEDDNSYILLMGVGYDKATAMHLGEYFSEVRKIVLQGGAITQNGHRQWVKYLEIELNSDEFVEIGKKMEASKLVRVGKIGKATCKLIKLKTAVDFTAEYLREKYK